jgi:O-antigen/teichoic acid export membrane protein/tetratricopeptide (TPR) repeat protein
VSEKTLPPEVRPSERAVGHQRHERKQFVEDNFLATASTFAAGILGFGLQAMSSHALHPGAYGKAFAVYSFFYLVTRPSAAFGRLQAWQTSRESSSGGSGNVSGALLRQQTAWLLGVGSLIALASILAGSVLGSYLHVPISDIAAAALGVPFLLAFQPLLGSLQGEQRFIPWSWISVLVNLSRFVLIALFIYPLGALGFQVGNTLAAFVTFTVCAAVVWRKLSSSSEKKFEWRPALPLIVTGIVSTIAFGVFQGADVILVEHHFTKVPAGQYAAVAAIASAVFFASGGVASAVFPMIAARHANGRSTLGVMGAAFGLCAVTGVLGTLFLQLFGRAVLSDFAGPKYTPGAHYLGLYALGMAMLAWLLVLVNTQMSLNDLSLLWVLIPATILRPVLVVLSSSTLLTVVTVSDVNIAVFAAILTVMYLVSERRRVSANVRSTATSEAPYGAISVAYPVGNGSVALRNGTQEGECVSRSPMSLGVSQLSPPPAEIGLIAATSATSAPALDSATALTAPAPAGGSEQPGSAQQVGPRGRLELVADGFRRRTRWLVERPWATALTVGAVGLVVRNAWLSVRPLSSGDWKWPSAGRVLEWFPWPSLWNDALGLSGANRFQDAFRFPVYAVNGVIGAAGGSWTVIEKVVYFIPFAVLLPVAGWLLAREVLGRTRWALLAPVLLLGNTYFLIEANGEIPLVLAEAVGCLALVAFLKSMRQLSMRWALVTSLLLGACAAADIRPAYVTAMLMAGYVIVLAAAEPGWRLLGQRLALGGVAALVFLGTQAFWIVPFATYGGHRSLPTAASPDFTILTLAHGLSGTMANWTGGTPAPFTQAPLDPMFMVLPLIALLPLAWRRMRPEVLWLALSAVVFAFLAKTNNPPFGGVYDWMYGHVPGFNLFREGSKFLYPIAIAYAVLIPTALKSLAELARKVHHRSARALRTATAVGLVAVLAISGSAVLVLERGQLGSTTTPISEPHVFKQVSSLLSASRHDGPVLWFGSPVYTTGGAGEQRTHTYTITSPRHPLYSLTGVSTTTVAQTQDVFQNFCPDLSLSYCYVNSTVFPYLVRNVGASYVISPGGPNIGVLPAGITPQWLREQLTSIFGAPTVIGQGGTQLLMWSVTGTQPAITTYPAVAFVDSGPWALGSVLPALEAMGVPAAYARSYDAADYPASPAGLPDTVDVMPRANNACRSSATTQVGVMAKAPASGLSVTVGQRATALPLLAHSPRLPGWNLYGPLNLPGGPVTINAASPNVDLGPCVSWSALAASAFGSHPQVAGPTRSTSNGEHLAASLTAPAGTWVELHRIYDSGWRLGHQHPTAVGDGMFNLYHRTSSAAPTGKLAFTFSTLKWEQRGLALSVATVLMALLAIFLFGRREKTRLKRLPAVVLDSRLGSGLGGIGLLFLGLTGLATAIEWFGVPSRFPQTAITGDPYSLDVLFGTVALALLGASLLVRLVQPMLGSVLARTRTRDLALHGRKGRRTATAAGLLAVSMLVAGCGAGSHGATGALQNAEQAGQTSPFVSGVSLIDARSDQAAKNPKACIRDYSTALKTFSGLSDAYAGRAQCYQSNGLDFPASVHDYTRALELSPGNPLYLLGRAAGDMGSGNVAAAIADYSKAVSTPASTPTDALAAIDGLLAINARGAAEASLQWANSRYPSDALVRVAQSDVALASGQEGPASGDLTDAVSLAAASTNPAELTTALSRICGYEVLRHEYQQALVTCKRAAVTTQGNSGAFDNLSVAEAGLGQLNSAIENLTNAIGAFEDNVGPTAQPSGVDGLGLAFMLEAQGRLYLEAQEPQQALSDYHQALGALPPGSPDFIARLHGDIKAAMQG